MITSVFFAVFASFSRYISGVKSILFLTRSPTSSTTPRTSPFVKFSMLANSRIMVSTISDFSSSLGCPSISHSPPSFFAQKSWMMRYATSSTTFTDPLQTSNTILYPFNLNWCIMLYYFSSFSQG